MFQSPAILMTTITIIISCVARNVNRREGTIESIIFMLIAFGIEFVIFDILISAMKFYFG